MNCSFFIIHTDYIRPVHKLVVFQYTFTCICCIHFKLIIYQIVIKIMHKKQELEGDKKIVHYLFLTFSMPKCLLLGVPLCLSLIGIYFLLKFKSFRVRIFYTSSEQFDAKNSTSIYTVLNDGSTSICQIVEKEYNMQKHYVFTCHLLNYHIEQNAVYPIGGEQLDRLRSCLNIYSAQLHNCGLPGQDYVQRLSFYGYNHHKVQIPNMFYYVLNVITQPLFILQQCFYFIWIARGLLYYTVMIVGYNLLVISINYHFLRRNYQHIKEMAEKQSVMKIIRQNQLIQVSSQDIVPGDLIKLHRNIPCDCVLVTGDMIVNEANFTGEDLPILKNRLQSLQNIENKSHWLFQGSEVLQAKKESWAIAVYTGFTSHRGRIIRKIINNTIKEPIFNKNIIFFFVQIFSLASVTYLIFFPTLRAMDIEDGVISFIYPLFVGVALPIGFIGSIHMLPGFSLARLRNQNITGKQPYKVYESSQIKTILFDKTGTLTQNAIQFIKAYTLTQNDYAKIGEEEFKSISLTRLVFATCHMVKKIVQDSFNGDQIDLRMFEKSKAKTRNTDQDGVLWQIEVQNSIFQVLRVNQFQSKLMSMSVLVRNAQSRQLYVFAKGSPQLISQASVNKCEPISRLLKQLSFQGLRLIGMGYKLIEQQELDGYLKTGREKYLLNLNMLGIACFHNPIKDQAASTIYRLRFECGIQVKMITGDNIYTAVHTAFQSGIISTGQKVAVCQIKHIIDPQKLAIKIVELTFQDGSYHQTEIIVQSLFSYIQKAGQNIVFAVEGGLLKPQLSNLLPKITVFARTSPQNKTRVVSQLKQILQTEYYEQTLFTRLFCSLRTNVCMVGDGANDLMAIQQADVGIALAQTDATFSTDFAISYLHQIQAIIREGKSISKTVIECLLISSTVNWQNVVLFMLMTHDLSSWRGLDNAYSNILMLGSMPFMFAFSKPLVRNTSSLPQINIMSLRNLLKYLLNNIVSALSYWLIFNYYWKSSLYQPVKPFRIVRNNQWLVGQNSNTIYFLLMIVYCVGIPINMYDSYPWKQPLYSNKIFWVWVTLCLAVICLSYLPLHIVLTLQQLPHLPIAFGFEILFVCLMGVFINSQVNKGINRFLEQKQLSQSSSPRQQRV